MKPKTASFLAYGVILICLAFVLGYLIGHGNGETQVTVYAAAQQEQAVQAEAAETLPETETIPAEPLLQEPTAENPLDLNTATQAELELLPGIGPGLAERIIAYRQVNGSFVDKEQIMDVEGIGEKRYVEIEPLIIIGGQK